MQFGGLCLNKGDVYPEVTNPKLLTDLVLGASLIINTGKRLFIEVIDSGWEAYDIDVDQDEEPYGYNFLTTTIVDLDSGETWRDIEEECEEDDRWQGIAHAVFKAIAEKDQFPDGEWEFVIEKLEEFDVVN